MNDRDWKDVFKLLGTVEEEVAKSGFIGREVELLNILFPNRRAFIEFIVEVEGRLEG